MKLLLLLVLGAFLPTSSYPVSGAGSNDTVIAINGRNTTTEGPGYNGPGYNYTAVTEGPETGLATEDTTTEDTNSTLNTEGPADNPAVKNTGSTSGAPNTSENNTEHPNNNGMRTFNQANNGSISEASTTDVSTTEYQRPTTKSPKMNETDTECHDDELDCDDAEDINKRTIWIISGVVSASVLIGICLLAYLRCYKKSSRDDTKSTTYATDSLHHAKYTELGQSEANCLQSIVVCDDTVDEGDEGNSGETGGGAAGGGAADPNGDGGSPAATGTGGDTGDNSAE